MNRNLFIVMMWKQINIEYATKGFYLADKRRRCTGRIPFLGLHLPCGLLSNVAFKFQQLISDSNTEKI